MKNFCIVGSLAVIMLAACGPKQTPDQANAVHAISAAEVPVAAAGAGPEATIPTRLAPQAAVPSPSPNPTAFPEDPNDPAEIQRRFLQTVNSAIKKAEPGLKTPIIRIIGNASHSFFAEFTGKFTYDIKKTDSIVSPLLGTVSWSVNWYDNGVNTNIPTTLDARYAYQNGQWVIKDLVRRVDDEKAIPADEYLQFFE